MMPPMMPPPMMMPPWGMPPPYMAMHACMMMQMHMQQAMAAQAKGCTPAAAETKPVSEATLAAKALGHPEGLPTYPAFPMPPPPAFFGMPAKPSSSKPATKPAAAKPTKPSAKAAPADAAIVQLTDNDFAAFMESFTSDKCPAEGSCDGKRASESGGVSSGVSAASSSDDLNLDDLLPIDAVWDAVESGDGALPTPASAHSLLELVTPRGDGADGADAEDDLIFSGMGADALDASLIL